MKFDIECMCVVCHRPIPMPWGGRLQAQSAIVCSENCHCYLRFGIAEGTRRIGYRYRQIRMLQERRREALAMRLRMEAMLKAQGIALLEVDDIEQEEDDLYGKRWLRSRALAIRDLRVSRGAFRAQR